MHIAHLPLHLPTGPPPRAVRDPAECTPGSADACVPGALCAPVRVRAGCSLGSTSRPAGRVSMSPPYTGRPLLSSCCHDGSPVPAPASEGAWDPSHAGPPTLSRGEPAPASRRHRGLLRLLPRRLPSPLVPSSGRSPPCAFARTPTNTPMLSGRRLCQEGGQLLGLVGLIGI